MRKYEVVDTEDETGINKLCVSVRVGVFKSDNNRSKINESDTLMLLDYTCSPATLVTILLFILSW